MLTYYTFRKTGWKWIFCVVLVIRKKKFQEMIAYVKLQSKLYFSSL